VNEQNTFGLLSNGKTSVRPLLSRPGAKPYTLLRVDRQRKFCSYLAGLRQPSLSARRGHSPTGGRRGDLEDPGRVAARQSRRCSESIAGRPVYEGNSQS
jgi:hypothetical protein